MWSIGVACNLEKGEFIGSITGWEIDKYLIGISQQQMKFIILVLFCITALSTTVGPPRVLFPEPNCYITLSTGKCAECIFGFTIVNETCKTSAFHNCKTFDPFYGICKSCYVGYSLQSNGGCAINSTANVFQNCAFLLFGTFCLACNPGSYFNPDGNCEPIDPNCVTFDYIFDVCTTCKTGYVYYQSRNLCVKSNSPPDAGCTSWIGDVCFSCVNGWTLYDGICVIANPNCRSRSLDFPFNCVACYPGYTLSGINCLPTPVNNPLCAVFDSFGACLVCSFRSIKNALGVCVLVNPLCNTFDQNGFCLSCYQGYMLSAGKCILPSDPNCLQWSGSTCVQCIPWTYYNGVNCVQVSTACRTFSSVNGKCTSCYVGWNLSNGVCSVSASSNDPNCKTFNSNGVCTACYGGYYYDVGQGKCLVSTKSCNGMDFYGNCLGCYPGYYLKAGDCYIIPSNCKTYDGTNNVCTSCYPGSTLSNGKCI